jgi:hypothetical protein
MTARAIRISNVSPPIALIIGLVLLSLVHRNQSMRCAGALLIGALLKYATLILLPLLIAMRHWRILLWLSFFGLLLLFASISIIGPKPFAEFTQVITPTLSRPSWFYGNQSLPGMLSRIFGRPFPHFVMFLLNEARFFTLSGVFYLLFRLRPHFWQNPVHVFAATGLLLSWLLIFSPIAWEHWPIFFCPIWGWLIWEAREPGYRRVLALSSLALMYLPAGIIQVGGIATFPIVLPEPFNSSQLFGVILLFFLASWRLYYPIPSTQTIALSKTLEDEEFEIDKMKYLNPIR